ncbi:plexin-C1 isoform X1 [Stegostoma tigrinum]|uniref:plexin-C1 isoform X1 n=1 Tax=Stegostoma tigrinum TaxID=3053191 RepID=UPI00202AD57A|nr:plexin-C1 isoform X1 [Stegostoma tigrinum]
MFPVKVVFLCLLLLKSLLVLPTEPKEEFLFRDRINNIAVSTSGQVFVATDNSLYQLNQGLGQEVVESTGPGQDGPCEEEHGCCVKWKEKANVNKILVVDERQQIVLTCGTLRLGACEVRELHNVSHYESDRLKNVAPVYPEASTVAFLVKTTRVDYLVTAVTPVGESSKYFPPSCKGNSSYYNPMKEGLNTIFVRNPRRGNTFLSFNYAEFGDAVVEVDERTADLQYVQGFQWQEHIYIWLNVNTSGPQVILMNVKEDGASTTCTGLGANLLCPKDKSQTLRVLSSTAFNITSSDTLMVAIFSGQGQSEYSQLCFYNMTEFNTYAQPKENYPCFKKISQLKQNLSSINKEAVFKYPGLLSVSARVVKDWIVLFLGTDDGQLIKLILDKSLKVIRPIVLADLESESPIHHNVIFDPLDQNYLYLASENEVRRIKVANCTQYRSCTDCLSAQDPFCDWHVVEKRCFFTSECESMNPNDFITMKDGINSCLRVTLSPLVIDQSFERTKLFTVEVTSKFNNVIQQNATCTLTNVGNKKVICTGNFTTECPCNVSENHAQIKEQPDPMIIEVSIKSGSLNFDSQSTVHNCYKIATSQQTNTPCTDCIKSGCHWCAVEHRCTYTSSCSRHTQKLCPQIYEVKLNQTSENLDIVLTHAEVLKNSNVDLNCTFDGKLQAAKWIGESVIQCVRPQFVNERRLIPVNVVYSKNSSYIIDNPNNITVYSCDVQKPGCAFCSPERICMDPVVTAVTPNRVYISGGLTVNITGTGLDVGMSAKILIKGISESVTAKSSNCTISSNTSVRCVLPESSRGKKTLCLLYDSEKSCMANRTAVLQYVRRISITKVHPAVSWISGGRALTVSGINLDVVQWMQTSLTINSKDPGKCSRQNSIWVCQSLSTKSSGAPSEQPMLFNMFGIKQQEINMTYLEDPEFYNFTMARDDEKIVITVAKKKDHLKLVKSELTISVLKSKEGRTECNITEVTEDRIKCEQITSDSSISEVEVKVGGYEKILRSQPPSKKPILVILILMPIMLLLFIIGYFWATKRKAKQFSKSLNIQMELLESQFRNQIREGFVELQTEGSDVHLVDDYGSIPFLDYKHFAARTFFPEGSVEYVPDFVRDPIVDVPQQAPGRDNLGEGFNALYSFLNNKPFLVTVIHNLEQQKDFSIKDRCKFASFLTIAFHSNLIYLTNVLDRLLKDLMDESTAQPKLLLRRTETVVEKLLTNWISLCMYGFLRESVGEPLFKLVSAIKQRIYLGPVDAVSGKALYTLNEDWLLWEVSDFKTLKLDVSFQLNTEANDDNDLDSKPTLEVDVLDCDTIGQAKEKIFEAFFSRYGYSQRFQMEDIDLEYVHNGSNQILQDIDQSTQVLENGTKKLNTVGHYQIPAGASVVAVRRVDHPKRDNGSTKKLCHLISPNSEFAETPTPDGGKQKFKVKEMYLTKLLSSKVALHPFVESLFRSIWNIPNNKPPIAIRHIFDILHAQAVIKKITDPDVLHIWKTNSLPLRFWINIIKNPQFVFDMEKTPHLDGCLSVIAQAFMDSFSLVSHKLGKHSPTNKVLYARDIPHYQNEVKRYYHQIAEMGAVSKEEMEIFLTEESKKHENEFKERDAMVELGKYIYRYSVQLAKLENEDIQGMNEGIAKIKEYFDSKSKCGWE